MKFVNYVQYIGDQKRVAAIRPVHRQYVRSLFDAGKIVLAGPFTDGSGALFVYEAETLEAAEAIAADDPYSTGGAFAACKITEWDLLGVHLGLLQPALDDVAPRDAGREISKSTDGE